MHPPSVPIGKRLTPRFGQPARRESGAGEPAAVAPPLDQSLSRRRIASEPLPGAVTYYLLSGDQRIAIDDPASASRVLASDKAQKTFEGVKGGQWPQSLGLGEGEPKAAVPAAPPPDDPPLGISFPKS